METQAEKNTPLMQQYFAIKDDHPESLLFFQVGDFYELFFDDAKTASAFLAIALTKRGKNKGEDIPLCGIPVHALSHYLTKLIKGGYRVALCEQLTKPIPGTVVQRGVTRVFTPATLIETTMLDAKSASYLLSLYPGNNGWGLVFGELLTAQLFATTLSVNETRGLDTELARFSPDEIILPVTQQTQALNTHLKRLGFCTSTLDVPVSEASTQWINSQFDARTLPFIKTHLNVHSSLTTLYGYLKKNQESALSQFKSIQFYKPDDYLVLDSATQKNLELLHNSNDGSTKNTLFSILDGAQTAMGSRTIKKWLHRPLMQKSAIQQRLETVQSISANVTVLKNLESLLASLADIERIVGRIALRRATMHDYRALSSSLKVVPEIKTVLADSLNTSLAPMLAERMADVSALTQFMDCSINDDSSSTALVKKGFDHNLDRLRDLLTNGQQLILAFEQQEVNRTGITSLKVTYNQISGYAIEVTNPNLEKVPEHYRHQQTMANKKRFVTDELKQLEHDLNKAHNELETVETEVFERIKQEIESHLSQLRLIAQSLGYIDALFGFAKTAYQNNYCVPTLTDSHDIIINAGRHPVVEQTSTSAFVPNNTTLTQEQATWLITGPNMGGKSTYLRQVALISIMAQCGSMIPADSAQLPIIDRIFTRIGSGDNVAEGKSTFLVEMEETAVICTQATKNSLVILDEVGRGTSTYDGIALAQAILEHIHTNIQAHCLFATHYHELTSLADDVAGIVNYHMACQKRGETIIFQHKIIPGIAHGSFGLDVAKLAHVPLSIVKRAETVLQGLHEHKPVAQHVPIIQQPQITNDYTPLINQLKAIDCDTVTPKQAFDLLWQLVSDAKKS